MCTAFGSFFSHEDSGNVGAIGLLNGLALRVIFYFSLRNEKDL